MRKLMTLMLGLSLASGRGYGFFRAGQEGRDTKKTKKKKGKKKSGDQPHGVSGLRFFRRRAAVRLMARSGVRVFVRP